MLRQERSGSGAGAAPVAGQTREVGSQVRARNEETKISPAVSRKRDSENWKGGRNGIS